MSTRKITVYATKGQQMKTINSGSTVWADLRSELSSEGYDMNSLHATENINRTDLVNDQAVLPEGEFTVFLRPKKTKSGGSLAGASFKELRAMVNNDDVKAHMTKIAAKQGKNWTQLSTDDLRKGLEKYSGSTTTSKKVATPAKKEAVKKAPSVKTEPAKKATPAKTETKKATPSVSTSSDVTLADLIAIVKSSKISQKGQIVDFLNDLCNEKEDGESESAKKARLAKEADDMMRGF